jgi:hypothetical protein
MLLELKLLARLVMADGLLMVDGTGLPAMMDIIVLMIGAFSCIAWCG